MKPTVRNTAKKPPVIRRPHIERFFSYLTNTHIPRILKKQSYSRNVQNACYNLLYMWYVTPGNKLDLEKEFEVWVGATAKNAGCDRSTLYRAIRVLRKLGLIEYRGQVIEKWGKFGCSIYQLGKTAEKLFFWFFSKVIKLFKPCCKIATLTVRTIRRQVYGRGLYTRIYNKRAKKDKFNAGIKNPAILI